MSTLMVILITVSAAYGVLPGRILESVGAGAHPERDCKDDSLTPPATITHCSAKPNIIININNFIYVPGAREFTFRPTEEQTVNIAQGHDVATCGYTRHERGFKWDASDEEEDGNGTQVARMKFGRRRPYNSGKYDRIDHPETKPIQNWQQLKRVQSSHRNERVGDSSADNQSPGYPPRPEKQANSEPKLNLFIDGKRVEPGKQPTTQNKEKALSQYFREEMKEILKASREDVKERSSNCFSKDDPPCREDLVTFRGGLELSYEEFTNIFKEIEERPGRIKLIVPGGVTGPLAGYFEKVNQTNHEQAIEHGVCLLDNGYLVPIKAMCRILALHEWLWDLDADKSYTTRNADIRQLHSSLYWTSAANCTQLELLSCLIKSDKVQVILPGRKTTPFAQFEQQEHLIPAGLLKKALVMLLEFRIPYITFRNNLYNLCISKVTNLE